MTKRESRPANDQAADISAATKIPDTIPQPVTLDAYRDENRPTWSDYPRKPYPGFKDPEDWRESVSTSARSEREAHMVRQVVDDANRDHDHKHQSHDHPWCPKCWYRVDDFERLVVGSPQRTPAECYQDLRAKTDESLSEADRERLSKSLGEGWTSNPGDGELFGVSDDALQAWEEYLYDDECAREYATRGLAVTRMRANRYITLHGRPPIDDFEPASEVDFDAEYLNRDELDELTVTEALIDGVLPRSSYGILRGRDGTYKSFVALDWALCLATGKPWQGRTVEPVRTLYIAGEGAHGIRKRVDAWESAWQTEVDPDMFTVRKSALNLYRPGPALDHLLERLQLGAYGLVIVDTLRRMAGAADGNGSDMGQVIDNLDRIKQATAGGTVLTLAHTDKGDNDTRGYSGIEDDADFVWHAKRDEDHLTLELTKMKDGPDGTVIHLQTQAVDESLVLSAAAGTEPSTTESQVRILDTLRRTFRDGAHGGQLLDATGLSKSTYYRALGELKDAGHILNTGTGRRPFYELTPNPVPTDDTTSHLRDSHESHGLPLAAVGVPSVPPPLRAGLRPTDTGTERVTAS